MITLPVIDGLVQGIIPREAVSTAIVGNLCTVYMPGDPLPQLPAPTLEELRQPLRAANLAKRIATEQAGIPYTFADGAGVAQTRDTRDLVNINGIVSNAMIAKAAGVTDPVLPFRDAANVTHMMTPDQAIAFGAAIGQAIAAAYQKKWDVDALIEALASPAAIAAFDLDAAWAE